MKLFGRNEKIRLKSCLDGETMTEMCLLSTRALLYQSVTKFGLTLLILYTTRNSGKVFLKSYLNSCVTLIDN